MMAWRGGESDVDRIDSDPTIGVEAASTDRLGRATLHVDWVTGGRSIVI